MSFILKLKVSDYVIKNTTNTTSLWEIFLENL